MFLLTGAASALGGTAAAGTAAAGTAAAGAASTGLSISSILQGIAGVGSVVASIAAGNAEAANLRMQANDAEAEKPFEMVQHKERQRSLLKAFSDNLGEIDTSYAASGLDLSVGSAAQARTEAYREYDVAGNTDAATTATRIDRLTERARNFRQMAKRAKSMGLLKGFGTALNVGASLAEQY